MGRKPANVCVSAGVDHRPWTHSRQDLPGYEQKPHLRPTAPGECAVEHETELEDGV